MIEDDSKLQGQVDVQITNISVAKKQMTKEEFLRKVRLKISQSLTTPADILKKAKFGDVIERTVDFVTATVTVHMDYSGAVGYNRTETYTEYEKTYDSTTKSYYQKPVTKERVVTDWRPHSGTTSYAGKDWAYSGTRADLPELDLEIACERLESESFICIDKKTIDDLKNKAEHTCAGTIIWPGDKCRDVSFSACSTCSEFSVIRVPFFEITYEYEGELYSVCSLALQEDKFFVLFAPECKEAKLVTDVNYFVDSHTQLSVDQIQDRHRFLKGIETNVEDRLKPLPTIAGYSWILLAVAALVAIIVICTSGGWGSIFPIVAAGAVFAFRFYYSFMFNKTFAQLLNEEVSRNINVKNKYYAEKLQEAISFFNQEVPLSQKEMADYPQQLPLAPTETPYDCIDSSWIKYAIIGGVLILIFVFVWIGFSS